MCALFVTCIVFYYMAIDVGIENGNRIGLAISQAIGLSAVVAWGEKVRFLQKPNELYTFL